MKKLEIRANLYLMLAAMIWGFAFVAQRVGSEYLGAFSFNGVRFLIGSLSLVPLVAVMDHRQRRATASDGGSKDVTKTWAATLPGGLLAGVVLFGAITMQQLGMPDTTAGKAGFITDLYIVLVPIFGLFLRHRVKVVTWFCAAICLVGLYFISVTGAFTVARGDLFELGGAFIWTAHILIIDRFAKKTDALKLSLIQFLVCSAISLLCAALFEHMTLHAIWLALIPLLYGGVCSVGVAYTLQTLGQRHSKPAHSAIIFSLESVFSAIGGALLLREDLGPRGYFGCLLMITGMLLSQLGNMGAGFRALRRRQRSKANEESVE